MKCKPDCKGECCGIIPFPKNLFKANRKKAQRKYQIIHDGNGNIYPMTDDARCVFLGSNYQCRIYTMRPSVCKMYGTIPELPCPYIDLNGTPRSEEEIAKTKAYLTDLINTKKRINRGKLEYSKEQLLHPEW